MAGDFPNLDSATISQWPRPNYIHPVTRAWLTPYSIALVTPATVVLILRIWSHSRTQVRRFGLDNILVIIAWIFASLFTAGCLVETLKHGFSRHLWDVESVHYTSAALVQWLSEAAFTVSVSLTKISVLCFYRRLELPLTKAVKRIVQVFIGVTVCYLVASFLTQLLLCQPISAYWTIPKTNASKHQACYSQNIYYPVHGSLGAVSSLYTIMVPYLVLRNRPMSNFQRTWLRAIASFSLIVVGAGIARTAYLVRLVDSENGDATWNGFNVFACAQLECQMTLICSSLPFLQHLVSQNPSLPSVSYPGYRRHRKASVVSGVSSFLSDPFNRFPLGRNNLPRDIEPTRPRTAVAVEIPEWEFQTLESPRYANSPVDEISYEQYVRGRFGPPAPPKDSSDVFEQYRRERGYVL